MREHIVSVRFSEDELVMIDAIAEKKQWSRSKTIAVYAALGAGVELATDRGLNVSVTPADKVTYPTKEE